MTRQLFNMPPELPPRPASSAPPRVEWTDSWALLDQLPGAVVLLDAKGEVVYLNAPAEARLDLPRAVAVGRDFFRDVFPQLERDGVGAQYREAMHGPDAALAWEVTLSTESGPRPLGLGMRSLQHGNRPLGILLLEDRSGLVAERQRRKQAEQLAAVGELAHGVAHEINNPLASIKSFAQLLGREGLDPEHAQALEIISAESSRIAQIINNLLSFAATQSSAEPQLIDLSELVGEVVALKRYALETAGIEIETDFHPTPSQVRAHLDALQRVILGLLCQAEKALHQREEGRKLVVRTRESTDGVVLYLIDNGPGIERSRLPQLFTRPGMGHLEGPLGLDVVADLVREQGGQIWADTVEGRGTAFFVRLPRAPQAAPAPEPQAETARPPHSALQVLVADDEDTLRLAISLFFRRQGHQVTEAANAHEALQLAQQHEFHVALIDVRMPGDGITLLDQLEAMPHMRGRTILMTGDATHTRVRDRIRSGAPALIKPFDMTEALQLVERLGRGTG